MILIQNIPHSIWLNENTLWTGVSQDQIEVCEVVKIRWQTICWPTILEKCWLRGRWSWGMSLHHPFEAWLLSSDVLHPPGHGTAKFQSWQVTNMDIETCSSQTPVQRHVYPPKNWNASLESQSDWSEVEFSVPNVRTGACLQCHTKLRHTRTQYRTILKIVINVLYIYFVLCNI